MLNAGRAMRGGDWWDVPGFRGLPGARPLRQITQLRLIRAVCSEACVDWRWAEGFY